jgi:hypothetical protein
MIIRPPLIRLIRIDTDVREYKVESFLKEGKLWYTLDQLTEIYLIEASIVHKMIAIHLGINPKLEGFTHSDKTYVCIEEENFKILLEKLLSEGYNNLRYPLKAIYMRQLKGC